MSGARVLSLSLAAAWAYTWAVFVYQELPLASAVLVLAAGIVAAFGLARSLAARVSHARMLEGALVVASLLVAVFVADVGYTVYENRTRSNARAPLAASLLSSDPQIWHGELFPRSYRPGRGALMLYKPNVTTSAESFGEFYHPSMLGSRTLRDSVLERHHLSYAIGPLGLRELEPVGQSRIFALGDSFAMGYATDEGKTWTDLLGASLGEPVYNLGRSSTGPKDQLEMLKYLLSAHADSMRPKHLLWMIFEGNDLENEYAEEAPASATESVPLFEGTVLQSVFSVPGRVKHQSVVRRLVRGELTSRRMSALRRPGRYEIDGVPLFLPLYHSTRWGYRLFNPADVERATKPRSYVMEHPNRAVLDDSFREMRDLAARHGFDVTMIVAPSDARLYGAAFQNFPTPSDRPHFAEYVLERASTLGFKTIDLVKELAPYAEREMLYYRDDHHWNVRGNAVAARVIEKAIAPPRP